MTRAVPGIAGRTGPGPGVRLAQAGGIARACRTACAEHVEGVRADRVASTCRLASAARVAPTHRVASAARLASATRVA